MPASRRYVTTPATPSTSGNTGHQANLHLETPRRLLHQERKPVQLSSTLLSSNRHRASRKADTHTPSHSSCHRRQPTPTPHPWSTRQSPQRRSYPAARRRRLRGPPPAGPSTGGERYVVCRDKADSQVQEEDATKLQFGDFGDGEALTIGEVQHLLQISRDGPNIPPPPDNKVYKQTVDYVNEFANADSNVTGSMRASALTARPGFLNQFEVAQIMYLRPEKVEVAVALIPR
ncbi:hypothetical protein VHUM_01348 [Vanrija humicola]|uniref:RNA polymerase Rpb4/RPC9 core domain-containing protein n=1 Tax=Vanrija humicola TaxID=5417 RepID=A0A7D8V2K2_VANHU|nr:hypothetical protein VHUM_01348 [Vanrija humicola]